MRRSSAAYLSDIVEACDAVEEVLRGVALADYLKTRSVRSAVEREFITIGEAVRPAELAAERQHVIRTCKLKPLMEEP